MIILKDFEVYNAEIIAGKSILFLKDSEGRDWYESQKLFDDKSLKFMFNSAGIVTSTSYDVSALWPVGNSVAEIPASEVPENLDIDGNWMFDGKSIVPRTYTAEEWQAKAEAQRQNLLTAANAATADWRTELQLDVISEEDKASLIEWITYIKALKVMSFTEVRDEAAMGAIVWPEAPHL
ncbi:tail fiber assembly protein [Pantoea agglomerans]|uniref:Tail fiber assembly protein n=1 Tax=Enterobacter agglomerans TaxID=549 RepID=A0ACC5PVK8_ENTAG|nr:tail fiber assembly protein [Pantoea agglomerans]MBD8129237.1 tail fiber assembly protein [Pantoea agglomerans]MBD8156425.1 tail fiber assembly protein [Pantoea agglomerans]WVL84650.1 tail fiber assembly protein [Pantoea agglomerans]